MDDTDRPLSVALAELARTMPDDPRRLAKVRDRARRARRRRTVAGAGGIATVGSLALGLVASGPGSSGGTTVTGSPTGQRPPRPPSPPPRRPSTRRPCRSTPTSSRSRPPRPRRPARSTRPTPRRRHRQRPTGWPRTRRPGADAADAKGAAVDATGAPVEETIDPSDRGPARAVQGQRARVGAGRRADDGARCQGHLPDARRRRRHPLPRRPGSGLRPPWATAPRSVSRRAATETATST